MNDIGRDFNADDEVDARQRLIDIADASLDHSLPPAPEADGAADCDPHSCIFSYEE